MDNYPPPKNEAPGVAAPKASKTEPSFQRFRPKDSRENAANEMFGAILLSPTLARCIPPAIHLSAYGLFTVKACAEGWGIEGIANALTGFGLDGGDIVNAAIRSVSGDPERAFWQAIRQLCEGVPA